MAHALLAQMCETALDLACALVDARRRAGRTVAIMATNRLEHVLADIGAMHAGAVPMSIYNTLSPDQVAYVADHSEPAVVVLETADHLARWRTTRPSRTVGGRRRHRDAAARRRPLTWDELLARGAARHRTRPRSTPAWRAITADDPATILYTSGTTGNPKGVVITHRNVLFEVESGNRTTRPRGHQPSRSPTCPTPTSPSGC